jgi:2-oxo-4-hydroxy-4-carboxy-5-ureidoimidazoline decarboxylase
MTNLIRKPSTLTLNDFVNIYGPVYEHSPWIAAAAYHSQPVCNIDTVESLHEQMKLAVANAEDAARLDLICAHPDLAVAKGDLTVESSAEQTNAGLKECTADEFAEFQKLNADYRAKFGFPFIVAVTGLGRSDILKLFRERIGNDRDDEFDMAINQIHKIAHFRLMAMAGE